MGVHDVHWPFSFPPTFTMLVPTGTHLLSRYYRRYITISEVNFGENHSLMCLAPRITIYVVNSYPDTLVEHVEARVGLTSFVHVQNYYYNSYKQPIKVSELLNATRPLSRC